MQLSERQRLGLLLLFAAAALGIAVLVGRATAPENDLPRAPELEQALLGLQDLPAGWTSIAIDYSSQVEINICDMPAAPPSLSTPADSSFGESDSGPFFFQSSVYVEPSGLDQWFASAELHVRNCQLSSLKLPDGESLLFEVELLSYPVVGEQSFAFRRTPRIDGLQPTTDTIVARRQNVVSVYGLAGIGGVNPRVLQSLVEKADGRLAEALQ